MPSDHDNSGDDNHEVTARRRLDGADSLCGEFWAAMWEPDNSAHLSPRVSFARTLGRHTCRELP